MALCVNISVFGIDQMSNSRPGECLEALKRPANELIISFSGVDPGCYLNSAGHRHGVRHP